MKVLQINFSDGAGGAAIAGFRLHEGLLAQGIDSKLLVNKIEKNNERVARIPEHKLIDRITYRVTNYLGLNGIHTVSSFGIMDHEFYKKADILNIHIMHGGYFNYLALPQITKKIPAVLTLHDMWTFTGHCVYSFDCERWKIGCGHCPYPNTYPSIRRDNTRLEWKLKQWAYEHSNITIVTLSTWLTTIVKQSLHALCPIYQIPNGINTDIYQPLDKVECRQKLGLPQKKKILLFGAQHLTDTRKGGDLLIEALKKLPESMKKDILLVAFGYESHNALQDIGIQVQSLGYISDDIEKAIIYSAADLFVFPTRADNLPLVLQESMACGTPMISFDVGGVSDLVRPGHTGYLAPPADTQKFAAGIVELLEDRKLYAQLSKMCRVVATEEFRIELQARRYIELYNKVVNQ